jgi:hypothetical protein
MRCFSCINSNFYCLTNNFNDTANSLRVANTNPTSIIYIFVYDKDDSEIYKELENDAKNSNICLLTAKKYENKIQQTSNLD